MENIHGNHSLVSVDNNTSFNHSVLVQLTVAFFLTIFILIAVAGNILVCIAIYTDRNLRHIGNLFTASLAVADLLVGMFVMPLALVNDLTGFWSLPQLLCGIWISFDVMGSTASILNLCAISLDRYIHIKDPLHYSATVTPRIVIPCCVIIWILSTLISFVPMNLGWHKPTPHVTNSSGLNGTTPLRPPVTITATFTPATLPPEISPPDDNFQCTLEINPIYAVTSSIISFYFPCVIMLIIYIRLYMEARRHVKSVREMAHVVYYKNSSSSTRNGRTPSRSAASDAVSSVQSRMVSEHKAAVTLGIIVSVFLICWAPFFAINIIHANCRCISIITFKALTWLGYCNSAFNPIIYSIFNQDFRKAFRKLLHVHICCFGSSNGNGITDRERSYSHASAASLPLTSASRYRTRYGES